MTDEVKVAEDDWPYPGDTADFAQGDIVGTVEEVIWGRGMIAPPVLVEYWVYRESS